MPKNAVYVGSSLTLETDLRFQHSENLQISNLHAGIPHVILSSPAMVPAVVGIKSSPCSLGRVHPNWHGK